MAIPLNLPSSTPPINYSPSSVPGTNLTPFCPRYDASEQERTSWLLTSKIRGEGILLGSGGYRTIEQTIDTVASKVVNIARQKGRHRSNVSYNRVKRQLREIVSILTQRIKPSFHFTTQNPEYNDQVAIRNKRLQAWMASKLFDRKLKEVIQWAVTSTGYLVAGWSRPIPGFMDTDLELQALGPLDVIPDQISQDNDLQKAYAVHIHRIMSFTEALAKLPASWGRLRARTISGRSAMNQSAAGQQGGLGSRLGRFLSPLLSALNLQAPSTSAATDNITMSSNPEVEIFYTYILDLSYNDTGAEIHSDELTTDYVTGQKTRGTQWEYTIPYLGQHLSSGRIATAEDCLLYPTRRLCIWSPDGVLIYDGPSFWWHGQVPAIPISLDKWPWEQLGYSLAVDNLSIDAAVNTMLRAIVDGLHLRIDPPLVVNERELSETDVEELDMREPGSRTFRSGLIPQADVITTLLPWQSYDPPLLAPQIIREMAETSDYQVGVNDLSGLKELQQIPAADSVDRLLQAAGPLTTDYARIIEQAITQFGYQAGWLFMEFDTTRKRLQILGKDGLTWTDFDYNPGQMIPADVPGVGQDEPLLRKALIFGRQFAFAVTPNTIFEFADTQNRMLRLQLWRDGRFPMDPWTLAEDWNLGNFGDPPADSIFERWQIWSTASAKFMAAVQVEAQKIMAQGQMEIQAEMAKQQLQQQILQAMAGSPQGAGMLLGNPSQGPENGTNHRPGRPPSGQEPPELITKHNPDGTERQVISES